ncbi:EpsI family protein [Aromatoleum evansii]|uniref:EpsI family protein n=1 Tax=Aromatoleum evansii TaxID=59406 RepID=A0ABZ1AEJ5_AROEV|nr:EpsI family protein [Aromatoleum evansii]
MTSNFGKGAKLRRSSIVACTLMFCASLSAWALAPRNPMAALNKNIRLETAIPVSFGDWHLDSGGVQSVVNPQQKGLLDALYSQTLTRTYVNALGQRIMLSIAYGEMQSGDIELHRPEVCYVAQGFSLETVGESSIKLEERESPFPIQRLIAQTNSRHEPISYWMRVGDYVVASGNDQRLARLMHGFKGWIPDGILFRVSSISDDNEAAYHLQERFVVDLLTTVDTNTRGFLIGPVSPEEVGSKR